MDSLEPPIVIDRRRKKAIEKVMDAVKVIMSGIRMLAAVRSTMSLGDVEWYLSLSDLQILAYLTHRKNTNPEESRNLEEKKAPTAAAE